MLFLIAVAAGLFGFDYFSRLRLASQLQEIRSRLEADDVIASRRQLLQLHASHGENADILELLAAAEMRSGDAAAAMEWLQRVPDTPADRAARARHQAGQLAMQLGRVRETEELALEALRLDPAFVEPRRLLIRCYFVLFQQHKLYEQTAILDQRGELSLQDLLMRCVAHRAAWDDDDHVVWLEGCMRADPDEPLIRAALARYYAESDRHVVARRVLKHASEDAPGAWRILLARAEDSVEQGQFRQAFDLLQQLPRPPTARAECGWRAAESGMH